MVNLDKPTFSRQEATEVEKVQSDISIDKVEMPLSSPDTKSKEMRVKKAYRRAVNYCPSKLTDKVLQLIRTNQELVRKFARKITPG